jgi:hypothetical protein
MSVSKLNSALRNIQIYTYPVDLLNEIKTLKANSDRLDMYSNVTKIKKDVDVLYQKASGNIHSRCNFKGAFDLAIQVIMKSIPSAVLDSHIRHMEEQSKK